MELILSLDGQTYEDPIDWAGLNDSLRWDFSYLMYTRTFNGALTLQGGAYNYLYGKVVDGDICALISCKIYFNQRLIIDGSIFITGCEFNETRRVVEVKIQDSGYSTSIQNNRAIDVGFDGVTTKNGEALTSVTEAFTICYTPSTGVALSESVVCYRMADVFLFLVEWMSDNNVTFYSDYFSNGYGDRYRITSGFNLRTYAVGGVVAPKVSFSDLYDCFRKLTRVAMAFDTASDGRPRMRIEPESFFRNPTTTITLSDVDEVTLSFVEDVLFASVAVGTNITPSSECDGGDAVCSSAVNVNYFGCDVEQYGLTGTCNIDAQLTLQPLNRFIYDTNTIEDIITYGNDSFDEDVVIIEIIVGSAVASDTDPMGIGQHWYNGSLMNNEVLARYEDYLLGSLSYYGLESGVGNFKADTFLTGLLLPVQLPIYTAVYINPSVVVFNPQNTWSDVTNRWTAGYDGVYRFEVATSIMTFPSSPIGNVISTQIGVEHYDSGGGLITQYLASPELYSVTDPPINYTFQTPYISCEVGDYCVFVVFYAQSLPEAFNQSEIMYGVTALSPDVFFGYFTLIDSRAAVGSGQINTGADLTYIKRSFSLPIADETANQISDAPFNRIAISNIDGVKSGWVGLVSRNFVTEQIDFEIITSP